MPLKRREFLRQSAAVAAGSILSEHFSCSGFAGVSDAPDVLTSAQLIWCAAAIPQPIQSGGNAEGIASSSENRRPLSEVDYHCVFARELQFSGMPERAVLHLFAFTRYRVYVNGKYVGRGPCRYQNEHPEYDSRDIRSLLQPGRNIVVVLVHRDAPTGRIMRHDPALIASLEWVLGGTRSVVGTDSSWLSAPEFSFGPRVEAWSSIEENIDARKMPDWTRPDLLMAGWKPSIVVHSAGTVQFSPRATPLQCEQKLPWADPLPSLPMDLHSGDTIEFQLREIAQAFHVLDLDATDSSSLEVSYILPQGEEVGRSTYIARAGMQSYMGGDTFAFRKLRLHLKEGSIRLMRATACEVRYPFQRAGTLTCSDSFLDQLWSICARSLEVLSEDAYVDCADRERVEWIDNSPPAFDCTRVMMRGPDYNGSASWGDARLLGSLLRRAALTQQPDGQLKAHTCSERFDIHAIMEDRSCGWVVLLRQYVDSTSDRRLVRELWPTLTKLLAWYRSRRTERGLVLAREWEVWDNPVRYQVCEGAGLNAMVYKAITDAAVLAQQIGEQNQRLALSDEASRLQAAFHNLLWNAEEGAYNGALFGPGSQIRGQLGHEFAGRIVNSRFGPTAQANLFALYAGIVPDQQIPKVREWILNHLDQVRETMSHYYLFQMLYAMGDEARDRQVLNLMRSAWNHQVTSEWQTTFEDLGNHGGSKIHAYGMHPAYFLSAYVLGARREGPLDRRTILIEPRFSGLRWAKGACVTEFGPVEMEWHDNGTEGAEITCTVPRGVRTKLRLAPSRSSDVLQINGRTATVHSANGWMETMLRPGSNRVRLQRSK